MINLRNIPAMDELLLLPQMQDLFKRYNREFVVGNLRQAVEETRQELRLIGGGDSKESLAARILYRLDKLISRADSGSLQKVINGTGVVLHTNLGRAPLGERALSNLNEMGRNYNNLEIDLETGERGSRYRHVEELLTTLTPAQISMQHDPGSINNLL